MSVVQASQDTDLVGRCSNLSSVERSILEIKFRIHQYLDIFCCCYSVTMSNSLWPRGLQHSRLPCPSQSPWICSNSHPLSQWHHPISLSSVIPFCSCLQSFPESGSFLMSWLFTSGGQSIGTSASASALPVNIQDWFLLGLTGLISLQSKGLSSFFYPTPQFKSINSLALSILWSNSHIHT